MPTIDDRIRNIDKAICRHIDSISGSSRAAISQDILARLVDFVNHIMLKFYSNGADIEETDENIERAAEYAQINGELKVLYKFRNYLQIVAAHYNLDEDSSERLMLKYYRYLLVTKKLVKKYWGMIVLQNLYKFPLNLDSALQEYYAKITAKIECHPIK